MIKMSKWSGDIVASIKDICHLIFRQGGFSLTEVTIGAAILTGVALTGAKLFKNERTAQRSTELDQKLSFYHQALTKILNMSENCNATMKNIFNTASPITPISFDKIYTCTSSCSDPNTGDLYYDAYTPGAYSGTPLVSVNEFIDKTDTWYVCKMEIVEGRVSSGLVRLRIGYCMNEKLKNYKISKDIFINTRFNLGKFRECVDGKENAIINLQNDLCRTITSGGVYVEWDEATQTCQPKASGTCQSGEMMDGRAECKKIINPNDAQNLYDDSVVPCNPPQSLKTQWNNTDKKFELVCQ
jgi:hypothetical protein